MSCLARSSPSCSVRRSPRSTSSGTWWKLAGSREMAPRSVAAASRRPTRSKSAGTLASVMMSCATLPAWWNDSMAGPNSASAASGSPSEVCRRAASRPMKPSKNLTRCSRTNSTPSSQASRARCRVDLGERQPDDPQRVGDPVGVAELSGRGDRRVGQLESLVDPTGRLQTVDVRSDPVCLRRHPRERRHRAGELHVAIEVAAVDLAERLDEGGVAGLAGVVAGLGSPVRSLGARWRQRPRRVRRSTRSQPPCRGVEDGGRRQRSLPAAAPRPTPPSRTVAPRSPSTRHARRHRSPPPTRRAPRSSETPSEGCRARSPPSRRRRAIPARSSAPNEPMLRAAKCAACRSRSRASPPVADSCSSANCLMVSNMPYLVWVAAWLTTTSDLRTKRVEPLEHVDVVGVVDDARRCPPGRTRRRRPMRCAATRVRRRSTDRTTSPPRVAASAGAPAAVPIPSAVGSDRRADP